MRVSEVVESFCRGKASPDINEDRLVILPHIAVVVDAASSSSPVDGVAGGIIAAEAVISAMAALPSRWTFRELVDGAT